MTNYICDQLIKKNYISIEKKETYRYGLEVLILNLIPIIIILCLSVISGQFIFGLLFLLSFVPIRINLGGFHCNKIHNCIISFILIYIIVLLINNTLIVNGLNFLGLISILFIYISRPITYDVIDNVDINLLRAKNRKNNFCFILVYCILLLGNNKIITAITMACLLNIILYYLGKIDLKKRENI